MGNQQCMKRDKIDLLVQLAFVEGGITTHGLYERTVAKRKSPERSSAASKARLVHILAAAMARTRKTDAPLTIGAFLRRVRAGHTVRSQDISSRLGITSNLYRLLEQDSLSPLRIPPRSWNRLTALFRIPFDDLEKLIRRTHQLVYFRASFCSTLARYDHRKGKGKRKTVLGQAAVELYTKADLSLPAKEEENLNHLLESIRKENKQR